MKEFQKWYFITLPQVIESPLESLKTGTDKAVYDFLSQALLLL